MNPSDIFGFIDQRVSASIAMFGLAVFVVFGVAHPLMEKGGDYATKALKHRPKLQYGALAVFGIGIGTIGEVTRWFDTARQWLADSSTDVTSWALGIAAPWFLFLIVVLLWINIQMPGGFEPTPEGTGQHWFMVASSPLIFSMALLTFNGISITLCVILFVLMLIGNKRKSKSTAGAGAPRY